LVEVDDGAWPLIVARMPEELDAPAIDSMFRGFDKALSRNAKFATVVDTTALSKFPDALGRQRIGEYMKARTIAERLYNLGNAVVIRSASARAVLTAINWIRQPVTAQHLVATFPEALEWCCERLERAGVPLSPALEALRARERAGGAQRPVQPPGSR
jgi:hypothetical protein